MIATCAKHGAENRTTGETARINTATAKVTDTRGVAEEYADPAAAQHRQRGLVGVGTDPIEHRAHAGTAGGLGDLGDDVFLGVVDHHVAAQVLDNVDLAGRARADGLVAGSLGNLHRAQRHQHRPAARERPRDRQRRWRRGRCVPANGAGISSDDQAEERGAVPARSCERMRVQSSAS